MLSASQVAGFLNQLYLQKKNNEITLFFTWSYKVMKGQSWLKHFWMSIVKNVGGHSGHKTLKLAESQEWMQ